MFITINMNNISIMLLVIMDKLLLSFPNLIHCLVALAAASVISFPVEGASMKL